MANFFNRLFGKKPVEPPPRDMATLINPLATKAIQVIKVDAPLLSHFGGSPNLPPEIFWPERSGQKLGFLARLSLPELHQALRVDWLPSSGALLFFYDMEKQPWGYDPKDRGGAVVLHVPDLPHAVSSAGRTEDSIATTLPHRNVAFRSIDSYPSSEHDSVRVLQLSETEYDLLGDLADNNFQSAPKHQVSGFPAAVQGDYMDLECQLASNGLYCGDASGYHDSRAQALKPGAANWRLLFQMDSDDDLDLMWGDCGTIYYWIEEQAARQGDFRNAWLILQCC